MTFLILTGVIGWVLLVAWIIAICQSAARADRAAAREYVRRFR